MQPSSSVLECFHHPEILLPLLNLIPFQLELSALKTKQKNKYKTKNKKRPSNPRSKAVTSQSTLRPTELPVVGHPWEWNQVLLFSRRLTLSTTCLRFSSWCSIYQFLIPSDCWIVFPYIGRAHFICPLIIDRHWSCFRVLLLWTMLLWILVWKSSF